MIYGMLSVWLALLLLATAEGNAELSLRGRLCIGDSKTSITDATCSDTSAATIAVKPADRERRFFWISADAKTAYAGVIAAKAESVTLDPKPYVAVDLTLDGDASRGWPLDLAVTLTTALNQEWKWKLTREEAKRLQRLYGPRGTYYLSAKAEHHHTQHARVVAKEEPVKLLLRLVPLTLARGVIVDADNVKVAGATIARVDGSVCATSNEEGAFTCELPERESRTVVVTSDGYASREAEVAHRWLDEAVDLGRIRLTAGQLLTVAVVRPDSAPVRVTLFHDVERYEHSRLKTITLAEGEETVRFDAGKGKYFVVVEGEGPLERFELPVTIEDEAVQKEIRIEPFEVIGRVRFGDEPLMEGELEVVSSGQSWRIPLPITAGAFSAVMWQKGVMGGWLKSAELSRPEFFESPELGENPSRWEIRMERRLITGRVLDSATKVPVTDTVIDVSTEGENSSSTFSIPIQADGTYSILANEPGAYTLRVTSLRHVPYSADFRITSEDRTRRHNILLESGVMQPIDVMMPGGAPFPFPVQVVEGVTRDRQYPEFRTFTNESGRYELRGLPGTSRLLYFLPGPGSFAIARVQLPRTNAELPAMQVIIPPPCCTLRVRGLMRSPGGVLVRYNGEFIPVTILRSITGEMMVGNRNGEAVLPRLPAGAYEIWAIASNEDETQLIATSGSSREPLRVGLSSGEQTVTVGVER